MRVSLDLDIDMNEFSTFHCHGFMDVFLKDTNVLAVRMPKNHSTRNIRHGSTCTLTWPKNNMVRGFVQEVSRKKNSVELTIHCGNDNLTDRLDLQEENLGYLKI